MSKDLFVYVYVMHGSKSPDTCLQKFSMGISQGSSLPDTCRQVSWRGGIPQTFDMNTNTP